MPRGSKNKDTFNVDAIENENAELVQTLKLSEILSSSRIRELKKRCLESGLLHVLVSFNDLEGVKVLIENVKIDVNLRNNSMTPLLTAAERGSIEIFKYLVTMGANVALTNRDKISALLFASKKNYPQIVEFLINGKINGDFDFDANLKDIDTQNALMWAARLGHKEVALQLLRLKDIELDCADQRQGTALILCANNSRKSKLDHIQIARALIDRGANIYLKNNIGVSVLMLFALNKSAVGILLLLQHHREKNKDNATQAIHQFVNEKDNQLRTPMHAAADVGAVECMSILIRSGAEMDPVSLEGKTPVMVALEQEHYTVLDLLIKGIEIKGKSTQENIKIIPNMDLVNKKGENLLIQLFNKAKKHKNKGEFKQLTVVIKLIKSLIDNTKDLNTSFSRLKFRNHNYQLNALALAVQVGDRALINLLLKKGANIDGRVRTGMSVFRFSAITENRDIVFPLLLKHKLNELCNSVYKAVESASTEWSESDFAAKISFGIKLLYEYLYDESEFESLKVQPDDSLSLRFGANSILILKNQDIFPVIQQILEFSKTGQYPSQQDMTQILKSTVKQYKEAERQKIVVAKSDEFTTLMLKLYNLIRDKQQYNEVLFLLTENFEENPLINSQKLNASVSLAQEILSRIFKTQEEFLEKSSEYRLDFKRHLETEHEIQKADAILEKLRNLSSEIQADKEALRKVKQDISTILDEAKKEEVDTPKQKTRGPTASDIIQRKIAEFARRRESDPEQDIATRIISYGVEKTSILIEKTEKLKEIILKNDNELRELESEKSRFKSMIMMDQKKNADCFEEEEEIPMFFNDEILAESFDRVAPSSKPRDLTLESQSQIGSITSILDRLHEVHKLLAFKPDKSHELSAEYNKFLKQTALWGGFGLLMEELKKLKASKVFPAELARIIRNFIFHEEGKLLTLDPELDLEEMCHKILAHLEAFRKTKHKHSHHKSESLDSFVTEINSKLFSEIIRLALLQVASPTTPPFEICEEQVAQARKELTQYQNICQKHPNLIEDENARAAMQIGLGRTIARLGSYTAAMKRHYYRSYKLYGYDRYEQYIKIGNRYRHSDDDGKQSWRPLIDSLVQEILLNNLIEPSDFNFDSIDLSQEVFIPFFQASRESVVKMNPVTNTTDIAQGVPSLDISALSDSEQLPLIISRKKEVKKDLK